MWLSTAPEGRPRIAGGYDTIESDRGTLGCRPERAHRGNVPGPSAFTRAIAWAPARRPPTSPASTLRVTRRASGLLANTTPITSPAALRIGLPLAPGPAGTELSITRPANVPSRVAIW